MDVKGPWSVRDDDQNPHYKSLVLVDDSGGRLVASIPLRLDAIHVDRHAREFARLIAAAPAMLEACEQVSEWLDFLKINYPDMPGLIRGVRAARAAIAQTES